MNPAYLFVYNRLISDPNYVEDFFHPNYTQFIREEFDLGGISDKNVHNLLLTLFYTYLSGKPVPIWKKDFSRLFGSILNRRKSEFFSMTGYTTQLWRGKRLLRHARSRRYAAREDITERMMYLPCAAYPPDPLELWDDIYTLMSHVETSLKTLLGCLYFLVTNPITAYGRGKGALPFTVLGPEVSQCVITSMLKSEGLVDVTDEDFIRYGFYRYPKQFPLDIPGTNVSSVSRKSMVFRARALWFFDQLRGAA